MPDNFRLGVLSPKHQVLSRFEPAGQVTVLITNTGQTPARFRLEADDHLDACHFEFTLPGETASFARQAELSLSPGETVAIPVRVALPTNALIGLGKVAYHVITTVTSLETASPSRSILHRISRPPLIGPLLTSGVGLGLLALGIFIVQTTPLFAPSSPRFVASERRVDPASDRDQVRIASRSQVNQSQAVSPADDPAEAVNLELTYEEIFQDIGPRYGLEWRLLAEIAYQESRMDPWALGRDHDMGLMQIVPATWNEWAPKVGVSDPYDPYSNVLVAAAYLAYVRDYARGYGHHEEQWMLIGYNWGPNNLRQLFERDQGWAQIPKKQRNYALQILQARSAGANRWQAQRP